jgi:hypothetical protein
MARTIYQKGQGFGESEVLGDDEQFTEAEVVDAALALITGDLSGHMDTLTVVVSAEWERKGFTQRGPIDEESSYRHYPEGDDLIVSVELRLSDWERKEPKALELQTAVRSIIAARAQDRVEAEIAALEIEERAAADALREKRLRLAALRGN